MAIGERVEGRKMVVERVVVVVFTRSRVLEESSWVEESRLVEVVSRESSKETNEVTRLSKVTV